MNHKKIDIDILGENDPVTLIIINNDDYRTQRKTNYFNAYPNSVANY